MGRRVTILLAGTAMGALTLAYSNVAFADNAVVCEFPAQSLQLQRPVQITNSAPQIQDIETDVCGNVVSYTETLTRTMTASPWSPQTIAAEEAITNHIVTEEEQAVMK